MENPKLVFERRIGDNAHLAVWEYPFASKQGAVRQFEIQVTGKGLDEWNSLVRLSEHDARALHASLAEFFATTTETT